ncbi:uncharacterized protein B0H18DRAFT_1028287 [Fomitopsis serialis]|uniref:uncharacterized protein n=1 Tax=Fomitopsis serialis TaxID=139415 RepID=UPI002008D443|nr:uncharacterized protein B0H18DRAFT_1028287 [Neoantrodia serialis]KAH9919314.1 hypothetical protein B0H18DRAFT_1028287 [Neoantrodia serialis]
MVSERVHNLTHSDKTLTSALAANPKESPGELGKKLYEEHHHGIHNPNATGGIFATVKSMLKTGSTPEDAKEATAEDEPSKEDLDRAAECGQFGTRPSDLFLKVCGESPFLRRFGELSVPVGWIARQTARRTLQRL